MTMMTSAGLTVPDTVVFQRFHTDIPADLSRGEIRYPARVVEVSATGVLIDFQQREVCPDPPQTGVVIIPALGQYKARRAWRDGTRAAYLFELTEFSIRALNALLEDYFQESDAAV